MRKLSYFNWGGWFSSGIFERRLIELAAVSDGDGLAGLPTLGAVRFNLLDKLNALGDSAKDDVPPVEPPGLDSRDEELAPVGVGAGVGH